jgi:hypothetical protein
VTSSALQGILDEIAAESGAGSGAIVVRDAVTGSMAIVASVGLDEAGAAALAGAINRPGHPVARAFDELKPTYGVPPMNPGGPALRSHLPLIVTRDGEKTVVGVLALAHDDPIPRKLRGPLETDAALAAAVIQYERAT